MSASPAVAVNDLNHRYGERRALDQVTFDVPRASLFGVVGPNGGGKTTLFKILATLLKPTSGTAHIDGIDVTSNPAGVRRHIGIVFQRPSLDSKLTAMENVLHQGHMYGLRGAALRGRARELLERFGLADRAGEQVEKLSGGMQRRVELAKSLLHRPTVLVLDEPSTGLDPSVRLSLMRFLAELRDADGVTSLVTTHLMDEADACDRVAVIDHGRLIAVDTPANLKGGIGGDVITLTARDVHRMAAEVSARFSVKAEVVDQTVRIEGDRGHEFISKLVEAFPGEVQTITLGKPTLEDVFVHLTGHGMEADDAPAPAEVVRGTRHARK